MYSPRKQFVRLVAIMVVAALGAAACTGSSVIDQVATNPTEVVESTVAPDEANDPTEDDSAEDLDPVDEDSTDDEPAAEEPEPTDTPDPPATSVPVERDPAPSIRPESLLGVGPNGAYGYVAATAPWIDNTLCDAVPFEALAGVDIAATRDEAITFAAGLVQAGDVSQMQFGPSGNVAAVLSVCGPDGGGRSWVQRVAFTDIGTVESVGEPIDIDTGGSPSFPWMQGWQGDEIVEISVTIDDPDNFENSVIEYRGISLVTGETVYVDSFNLYEDTSWGRRGVVTSPDGRYQYRAIDDPSGLLGCEAAGPALTIEVDDGSGPKLALGPHGIVFSTFNDMHFGPDGLVAWTSGCEGFTSVYVGRIVDGGFIGDGHLIDINQFAEPDSYVDYQHYRLTSEGDVVALGSVFSADADPSIAVGRFDLAMDPQFVNTAESPPGIDERALATMIDGELTWHVGDTLGAEPACGGKTLYLNTGSGFQRAFFSDLEIDTIVDIDVSETNSISYDEGPDFVSREIVLSTECPGEYEGRRVWFGLESANVRWGLAVGQADLGEVAEVLSVRVVKNADGFSEGVIAEVERLDGTIEEVPLEMAEG